MAVSRSLDYASNEDFAAYAAKTVQRRCRNKFTPSETEEITSRLNYCLTRAGFWIRPIPARAKTSYIQSAIKTVIANYVSWDEKRKDSEGYIEELNEYDGLERSFAILEESLYLDKIWLDGVLDQLGPREQELCWMCVTNPTGWVVEAQKSGFPQWEIENYRQRVAEILIQQGITPQE